MTLEGDTLIQIQKWWDDIISAFFQNVYQQTRSRNHKNHSEHNITTSLPLFSHQTHILNFSQKNKAVDHYQDLS